MSLHGVAPVDEVELAAGVTWAMQVAAADVAVDGPAELAGVDEAPGQEPQLLKAHCRRTARQLTGKGQLFKKQTHGHFEQLDEGRNSFFFFFFFFFYAQSAMTVTSGRNTFYLKHAC